MLQMAVDKREKKMAAVKFHAGMQKQTSLWVACGSMKVGNEHGGVTSVAHFKTLPILQQCSKCAKKIALLKL